MWVYFVIFSALVIGAGLLVANLYEWRHDALYGPYVRRNQVDKP